MEEEEAEEANARVEYRRVYAPTGERGGLGVLAAHDWETYHLDMERKMVRPFMDSLLLSSLTLR